jgi:hypothetical protein
MKKSKVFVEKCIDSFKVKSNETRVIPVEPLKFNALNMRPSHDFFTFPSKCLHIHRHNFHKRANVQCTMQIGRVNKKDRRVGNWR